VLDAGADTILVTLTNATTATLDAGELLTGIDFSLGGLSPSLSAALGIQRTVDGAGAFVDTGAPQSLSWSLAAAGGGVFKLDFTPNAKDAIIGSPTAGSYAGANGSNKANNGHNPFAAQTAQFTLSVPNLEADTPVVVSVFRFGTALAAATPVHMPEPSTGLMAAAFSLTLVLRRRVTG
jgi:hypothetical protein